MAYTSPSQTIEVVPEGAMLSFTASGTIKAGQAVVPVGSMQVYVPANATANAIGIAGYDVSDGDMLLVWGPGNIVKARISGSGSDTVGCTLAYNKGWLDTNGSGRTVGILLEAPSSLPGTGKVLLI
ncbi:MAG: hypothetical protein ACTSPB_25425 [Candidatus Thorarchaeota archaeon]